MKLKFLTPKFIENAIRFVVYFMAVALTPFLGRLCAPVFDWVAYSFLRGLFVEIFTVLFWLAESIGFHYLGKYLRKKGVIASEPLPETVEEEAETGKKKKKKREAKPPMPLKNLWILTGICAVLVFAISAIIGFKVKPFYDLGEKITGYDLWNAVGVIGRNAFKCMWVLAMLRAAKRMADEIVRTSLSEDKQSLSWFIGGAILLLFGIFDIFTSVVSYPMKLESWLLAVAYFVCYIAFPAVYYFAEENQAKAYFLIVFIYLF